MWLRRRADPPTQAQRDFTPRSVSFTASGICVECCSARTHTADSIYEHLHFNQLQKLANTVREKQPRHASFHILNDNRHVAKETCERNWGSGKEGFPAHPTHLILTPLASLLISFPYGSPNEGRITRVADVEKANSEFFECQSLQLWEKRIANLPVM